MTEKSAGKDSPRRLGHHWPLWALILIVALLVLLAKSAAAQSLRETILKEGKADYVESCSGCHGQDATGTGELAVKLVKPPRDLTAISKSNGGTFPFWRVFEIIAGEKAVEGHTTHQMPDFASRMAVDNRKPGYQDAHVRVLQITHYLESLQK